jgi:hypothetical protein
MTTEGDPTLHQQVKALGAKGNTEVAFLAGRRSMAYELAASGGLNESKLGMEILFLLPDEFVEFYEELFNRALKVDSGSTSLSSGGVGKAKGAGNGIAIGSSNRLQSAGSGKRFKNPVMAVKSERALKAKEMLDAELVLVVHHIRRWLQSRTGNESGNPEGGNGSNAGDNTGVRQCHGIRTAPGHAGNRGNGSLGRTTLKCRMFLKDTWDYCPRCGTRVGVGG